MLEPKRLKVLGIMNIIFASIGFFLVLFGLIGAFANSSPAGLEDAPEVLAAVKEIEEAQFAHSIITTFLSLVVAILCLLSGIALVRQAQNCIKLANFYVMASLGAKVIGLILFFVVVNPSITRILDSVESPTDEVATIIQFMKGAIVVAGIVFPLLFAVYPIIVWVMLNKPDIKNFVVQHGK